MTRPELLWKTNSASLSSQGGVLMYFVGIDISKYKHDCFIATEAGEIIQQVFTFQNDHAGFSRLLQILDSLDHSQEIRIGFEATGHYGLNLKLFLEKAHYRFMEANPVLLSKFLKSQTLRKTKTDAIDSRSIAYWLMSVEYKPHPKEFYHMYSLKSLTRLRDSFVKQRSFYLVKITNVLDHIFPEFKPFFKNRFSVTALYLLNKYHSPKAIAQMRSSSYDELRRMSRGKFTMSQFFQLKDLAGSSVGESNQILESQLISLLKLYFSLNEEIQKLEAQITQLVADLDRPMTSIVGVGPLSAAAILSEFGSISRFASPAQMLSFAGLEPGYYQSGTSEHGGRMVKRGSSHLRFTLMNVCVPLIRFNVVFAEYYHKKRSEGKSHRVAMSHVAKKLVRIIYTLETRNILFDSDQLR
jgi:transposase